MAEIPEEPTAQGPYITFHYIKSPDHRTHHVDGAIGGPTPRGLLYVHLYSERRPMPKSMDQSVTDGELGEILRVDSKQGVIRDVSCGLIMDLAAAASLHTWLGEKIEELDRMIRASREPDDGPEDLSAAAD